MRIWLIVGLVVLIIVLLLIRKSGAFCAKKK